MTYEQTIDYLFTRLPMFSRIGDAAIKKDLANTIELCRSLDNPHEKFKSVHIAGTNGKGSTSHMLAAILQSAGYKTGLYTSPHLKDFRERIKINGEMVEKIFVTDFTEKIKPMIESIKPSFFEITVAMAFDYFVQQQIDIAIIETGLGGRLDSTNIIRPELSVITNIGFDHMNILGGTIEEIAREKAGIIKHTVPVVIGETTDITLQIFEETSKAQQSPVFFAKNARYVADWKYDHSYLEVSIHNKKDGERTEYILDLTGYYQLKNLVTVLESVYQLKLAGWEITEKNIQDGLKHVKKLTGLHGRWEVVHHHPTIVFDVAHNEDGMRQLVAQLELTDYEKLHIVIGMVKDKEVEKVLSLLPKEAIYYFTKAQIPRALHEDELKRIGKESGLQGNSYAEINMALQSAQQQSAKNDLILVCGSVYVVGEVGLLKT